MKIAVSEILGRLVEYTTLIAPQERKRRCEWGREQKVRLWGSNPGSVGTSWSDRHYTKGTIVVVAGSVKVVFSLFC